ncbi:nose resistant to fluoxetine protein 6-like isoform X7 [Apostichopus japonicus]|uniref:nose resistant to fluoxetine protein 6-like isoform X7 n=1 Tax=Stichopus japonicus TaxID=307972 RepID=UPI003AB5E98D
MSTQQLSRWCSAIIILSFTKALTRYESVLIVNRTTDKDNKHYDSAMIFSTKLLSYLLVIVITAEVIHCETVNNDPGKKENDVEDIKNHITYQEGDGSTCKNELYNVLYNATNAQVAALNAFGIPNTGLLAGTRSWYGHFSGCTELPDFQYCMLTMHVNTATLSMTELHQLSIRWGICAPKICSDNGIHDNVEMLTTYLRSSTGVNLTGVSSKAYCVQNNRVPYSSGFYITGGVFGLICVLMIIGSMIDIIDDDNEVKDLHGTETEESLPLMTSAIGKKEEKEAIQEMNKQSVKGKVAATIKQILLSFAFNRNLSKLTVVGSDGNRNIGCLHGIRVISMVWIVLLHVCLAIDKKLGYLDMFNPHDGWRMFRSAFYQIIIYNGSLPVDTFFFLSGLLVCNATLFKLEKNNGSLSWPWFFLHRYIRLTPILAVAIAIWVFVAPHTYWGPNMDTFMDRSACESYWWTNLLYIQNFVQMSIQCYPLAWYLSADMQLFLASPFIIYSLYRSQRLGLLLIAVLVSASVIVNGIIVAEYNFNASSTANAMFFGDYLDIIYTKPYIRMQAYLVGMVVGFMIYKAKDKEIILPKPVVVIAWLVATSLTAAVFCVTINHHTINPSLGKIVDVTYQSLHRVAWGVFLAWVVIYCHLVKSGWINNFLSWHAWVPLSRLSYTVYIIHFIVFWTFIGNLGQPFYTTSLIMIFNSVAVTCVSFMFAAFLYLSVELPVANLEQKFLPRP